MTDFGEEIALPWPRPGDRLFTAADDWWMNACLNWGGTDIIYAVGYRTGGDVLIDHVAAHRADADALVYPIVFCYRQYLELTLKGLLVEARAYFDEPPELPPNKHPLLPLWQRLRPLLERRWPEEREALDAVQDTLRQFDAADAGSYAFRYSRTPKGDDALPDDMLHINLRNLKEVIARAGSFLDATRDALDAENTAADYDHGIDPQDAAP